jgi:hypothetical protein
MKTFKTSLHLLISFASVLGFLGGWATLAHSRKPIQPQADLAPLPALQPVGVFGNNDSGVQIVSPRHRSVSSAFMTRGS